MRKTLDQTEAREAVNMLNAIIERHEEDDHHGETCEVERAGMVAYVAHCLGVPAHAIDEVRVILIGYEHHHDAAHAAPFDD